MDEVVGSGAKIVRRLCNSFFFVLAFGLLSACAAGFEQRAADRVDQVVLRAPEPSALIYCTNYGCEEQHLFSLNDRQWEGIKAHFFNANRSPEEERRAIAQAAADYELAVMAQTGTGPDVGGTLVGYGRPDQTDCIDETANMVQFLELLQHQGLLLHHRVASPVMKDPVVEGWFHFSATIAEIEGGAVWSVDSWYFDSGHPALVLPVEVWRGNLEPLVACMAQEPGALREQNACKTSYPAFTASLVGATWSAQPASTLQPKQ